MYSETWKFYIELLEILQMGVGLYSWSAIVHITPTNIMQIQQPSYLHKLYNISNAKTTRNCISMKVGNLSIRTQQKQQKIAPSKLNKPSFVMKHLYVACLFLRKSKIYPYI